MNLNRETGRRTPDEVDSKLKNLLFVVSNNSDGTPEELDVALLDHFSLDHFVGTGLESENTEIQPLEKSPICVRGYDVTKKDRIESSELVPDSLIKIKLHKFFGDGDNSISVSADLTLGVESLYDGNVKCVIILNSSLLTHPVYGRFHTQLPIYKKGKRNLVLKELILSLPNAEGVILHELLHEQNITEIELSVPICESSKLQELTRERVCKVQDCPHKNK